MLTSSDAKWRCLWHMFIWSVVMTLVSQFLEVVDFIAYFFFAAVTVLILPVLTSIYSNTSGQRGSSLIRVGYVVCDPVLACITIVPGLILNHLPQVLDEYHCVKYNAGPNSTLDCLQNKTSYERFAMYVALDPADWNALVEQKENEFLLIEIAIVAPILIALFMGRRTRKMRYNTQLLIFAYWFIAAVDANELLETAMLSKRYKHVIFTTEAIVSIALILSNSYAVVTLCSYLTPKNDRDLPPSPNVDSTNTGDGTSLKHYDKRFDFIYKALLSVVATFFCELPLLVARFQILFTGMSRILVGTFVLWIIKNLMFITLILLAVFLPKLRRRVAHMRCKPLLDSNKAFFKPEKRDAYIYMHQIQQARPSALKRDSCKGQDSYDKPPKRVTFQMDVYHSTVQSGVPKSEIQEESSGL